MHGLFNNAKLSTTKRNNNPNRLGDNTFDITYEYLVALLRDQCGKCAYSNIKLNYGSSREKDWIASLERINPLKGYTKDNVCLVCAEFNGVDFTASAKYSNGGSGAWSKKKFNFFLSTLFDNIGSNPMMNLNGLSISLDMWKSINNPSHVQRFYTANFRLEIVNLANVPQTSVI